MQGQKLVIQNKNGEVLRTLPWTDDTGVVVFRNDLNRVEVWPNEQFGLDQDIPYKKLGQVERASLQSSAFHLPNSGQLRLLDFVENPKADVEEREDSQKMWWALLALMIAIQVGGLLAVFKLAPHTMDKLEEELKVQVVQVIQRSKIIPKPTVDDKMVVQDNVQQPTQKNVNTSKNVKRLGALAVLGSLKGGKQKGGLNLGAAQTSAGPGLGGTGGSGGVQTSLYAKGIVSAPVGPGANVQGAGGYGTKGKGGGQAGYGQLSLVGSAGTSTIPLGQEAIIEGGLDRDQIAEVVQRNMGQVRFCYEQGLQSDPSLAGRVVANWTINSSGQVVAPAVANSTLQSKTVEDCIMLRMRSWKFPLPRGGVDVKVSYPFVLKRVGA